MDPIFLSPGERVETQRIVNNINKEVNQGKLKKNEMDRDAFLKLLITQLANQDPTKPMEDKEFIAQMAQFSTLEQINNMSDEINNLSKLVVSNNVLSLIGRKVKISDGENVIEGVVEKIMGGDTQQIFIDGNYYDYKTVESIIVE